MTDLDSYSDEFATLGDRIAAAREALGFDQAQLAERLGVKLDALERWEFDQSEPRANRLQMLAGVLNVSLVWLMSGEGEGGVSDEDDIDASDADAILKELREIRTAQVRLAERSGRLETKLRQYLHN